MDPIIVEAAEMAARIIQNELRTQAPSEKIASGLTVVPVYTMGEVDFDVVLDDKVKYGIYLDSGTEDEKKINPDAEWNPNPGKGQGGIKPRYWTNLNESIQVRIDMIIEEAWDTVTEKKLDEQLNK
jgi:hypothetical protein